MVENGEILVSVSVLTYNHEKYIEETLVSILSQEVDFKFEILVHDDASTDSTIEIIEKLRVKNPNIIKVIYQSKNQYSRGIKINSNFNLPRVKGRYVAFCEGDDYWCDKKKLKKQVNALEGSDSDMCCHPTIRRVYDHNEDIVKDDLTYGYFGDEKSILDYLSFVKKGGGLTALSSILIRNSSIQELRYHHTKFYCQELTHFIFQLIGSRKNGAIYLPEYMSVYRSGIEGSWSASNKHVKNSVLNIISYIRRIKFYNKDIDKRYRYQFKILIIKKLKKLALLPTISFREKLSAFREAIKNDTSS